MPGRVKTAPEAAAHTYAQRGYGNGRGADLYTGRHAPHSGAAGGFVKPTGCLTASAGVWGWPHANPR